MDNFEKLRGLLRETLNLESRADLLTPDSRLLGALPELDSMAVVGVVAAIESDYGIKIAGHELSAELFSTVGTLNEFIEQKLRRDVVETARA
jgi:acyl carrier protein